MNGDVLRITARIEGICINLCAVRALTEKLKGDVQVTRSPIGYASEVPLAATSSGDRNKFTRLPIQYMSFVPGSWNILQKLETRVIEIHGWHIGDHLQPGLENNVKSKLLSTCAHNHWVLVACDKVFLGHIIEAARRVIHRSGQHAGEREDCTI